MATIRGLRQIKIKPSNSWTPAQLFTGGQTGFWLDAKDNSTMRQNSDGTGSVSSGDPVGWWTTKAGQSINFIQATSGNRPTWSSTNSLEFLTATRKMLRATGLTPWARFGMVFCAVYYTGDTTKGENPVIVAVKSAATNDYDTDGNWVFNTRGLLNRAEWLMNFDPTTLNDGQYTYNRWEQLDAYASSNSPPNTVRIYVNGGGSVSGTSNQPSTTPIWDRISIGSRETTTEGHDGYIGDIIVRMEAPTADEITNLRTFLKNKYGTP